ncbi:uncharacterized protein LOC115210556 isoform X1 [Octopus sinensis]|uniref:Uncharacterized protein LOC115210556 isoform X1 n=2 Tax=Octopus sinensis TaxID=2607531 RepID=A0A6P7SAA4_9MOLL|nr:uncharacterized protein LOC115210556 isoform X1 [Octopus sinensis]
MASENLSQDSLPVSPTEAPPIYMKQFDDIIVNFMKEQGIPGAAVALSYKGEQIYRQGYGMASLDRKVHPDSVFRIASISKTLTAIGILVLWQQKKLELSAKVFGPKGILNNYKSTSKGDHRLNQITVKHLLQHSAGWDRDQVGDAVFWNLDNIFKNKEMSSEDKLLRFMMSKKLQFTPGKRHSYSNLGYLILGKVIEKVEQKPYTEFLKEILQNVNITNMTTGHNNTCGVISNDEVNYFHKSWLELRKPQTFQGWTLPNSSLVQMDGAESYGGWVANASDVLQLFNCLFENQSKLLEGETVQMMLNRPEYENGDEWYGFGLEVEDNGCSWGHTGAMEGTSCTVMHDKSGLTWVLLFNAWSKDMDLNGLMRYGLSVIPSLPLWHEGKPLSDSSLNISTEDGKQVVTIIIPHDLLQAHVDMMMSLSYSLHWLSSHQLGSKTYFNTVWHRSSSSHSNANQSLVCLDVSVDNVDIVVSKQCDLGFSVKLLETYCHEGHLNFLIVFENVNVVCQKVYTHQSPEEHLARISELKKNGWHLTIQSLVSIDDCLVVSSVYAKTEEPGIKTVSWLGITLDNFVFELKKQINNKLTLIYVKFFNNGDNSFVSAIWNSKQEKNYWQRHSVSRYGFLYEVRKASAKNLHVDYVSSYVEDGVVYFAAFWPSLG